ncbi:MAG: Crp/Fnr family transcriptional regulator [Nitrospirae bacterium]|nr:Crp/Fnr family transcriptional regulator [Nitrospirota bacterium]
MIIRTLKKCEIFTELTDKELSKISVLFEERSIKKDEYIFMEEDPSGWFYILSSGRVKIVKHSQSGKDIILEIISPGDVFGGVAVLDKKPFPASAQAMEPVSVVRISRRNLFDLMEEHPVLKLAIVKSFSDRLRNAHETLKNIATERVERRIASLLLKLSEKVGIDDKGYKKLDFPLTRQEIAEMVGTTVETCIRSMSKFQKEGRVKSSGGRIFVNADSLKGYLKAEENGW